MLFPKKARPGSGHGRALGVARGASQERTGRHEQHEESEAQQDAGEDGAGGGHTSGLPSISRMACAACCTVAPATYMLNNSAQ